ncbi:hypothetical protein R3P38DRAFT_2794072 [Favolaschia claudopus]|uniref:CCHC-type domain-containing protein n=1 Tax=Favolaschia claudopus TaxID=2862362 RepID=A0AAW0AC11_9AGAR
MDVTVSLDVAFGPVPIADFEFDCLRNSDVPCDGMVTGMQCSTASQHAKETAAEVGLGVAAPQGQADPPLCLEIAEPKGDADSANTSLEIAAPTGNADSAAWRLGVAPGADSADAIFNVARALGLADSARDCAGNSLNCLADSGVCFGPENWFAYLNEASRAFNTLNGGRELILNQCNGFSGEPHLDTSSASNSQAEVANGDNSTDGCGMRDLLAGVDTGLSQSKGMHTDAPVSKDFELANTCVLPALNMGLNFEIEVSSMLEEIKNAWTGIPIEPDSDSDEFLAIFCGMTKLSSSGGSSQKIHSQNRKAGKSRINDLRRERSEMPHGGWFRATTELPSSSSEDSDSSSTSGGSSASSYHRNSVFGLKIKKPLTYDGRADIDILDQWTYEVDTWQELHGISDKMMVKIIVQFMSGTASRFFMKHVALRQKDWTPKLIYEALFNYCFPPDFKLQLRDQLTGAKQGRNDVRDFQRDIETLAIRFPDVTERQIRQIFWNGISTHLRMHLIGKGLDPERSSLRKMVRHAARFEAARMAYKREISVSVKRALREASSVHATAGSRTVNTRFSSADETSRDDGLTSSDSEEGSDDAMATSAYDSSVEQMPKDRVLLPQAEYELLRREGRCFKCRSRGHLSRDCPKDDMEDEIKAPLDARAAHLVDERCSDETSNADSEFEDDSSSRQTGDSDSEDIAVYGDSYSARYSSADEQSSGEMEDADDGSEQEDSD